MRSCGIHLKEIPQQMILLSILEMTLKIIDLRLQLHLPGANELKSINSDTQISILCKSYGLIRSAQNEISQRYETTQLGCISTDIWLTHCGLVTPYGNRDLGQHWLR